MLLNRVTITGADDNTDIQQLLDLSAEFPFVEWGILVSKGQEGGFRFPSRQWITEFCVRASKDMKVSMHVCGSWVRDMLVGELDWLVLPDCADLCQRVQINTHGQPHVSTTGMLRSFLDNPHGFKEYIFQWDGVNNHLAYAAQAYASATKDFKVSALYDTSAGAGILPEHWEKPLKGLEWTGYAGGLGPDNVADQILKIAGTQESPLEYFWIDMERRVRSSDDSKLDLLKVQRVLQAAKPYIRG